MDYFKKSCLIALKKGLLRFNNFNPQFGRKRYKILTKITDNFKKKVCGKILEFNDTHIKFFEKEEDNFISDHLNYNETYLVPINIYNRLLFYDEDEDLINNSDHDSNDDNDDDSNDDSNDDNDDNDDTNDTFVVDVIPPPTTIQPITINESQEEEEEEEEEEDDDYENTIIIEENYANYGNYEDDEEDESIS